MYYFISYTLYILSTSFRNKQSSIAHFAIVASDGLFWILSLWRHHSWSVTSREREALALLRHIRRLLLHPQIGAKAIFTSE